MEHRVECPFPGSTQRQRDTKHSNYKVDQLDKKSVKMGNWVQMKVTKKSHACIRRGFCVSGVLVTQEFAG